MIIPYDSLPKETLINIIESFVLREGTDYGEVEASLREKVEEILAQLKLGTVFIDYSEETESINIISNAN